jgi:hypothetical protein
MSEHQTHQKQPANPTTSQEYSQETESPLPMRYETLIHLQRTIGNAAVQRLLKRDAPQVNPMVQRLLAGKLVRQNSLVQRLPEMLDDVHITGTETLSGDLYTEGAHDTEGRDGTLAPHLSGIHPSDANQGYLGDCFAIAPLATVATQNPALIYRAIQDNGDGTFAVTLYKREYGSFGSRIPLYDLLGMSYVLVPQVFQVTPEVLTGYTEGPRVDLGGGVSAVAHNPEETHIQQDDATTTTDAQGRTQRRNELWAVVMERAFGMMLSGSSDTGDIYTALDTGAHSLDYGEEIILEALTGQPSTRHELDDLQLGVLARLFNLGYAITMSTTASPGAPMLGNHAYYLAGVDEVARTITLRNPATWEASPNILDYAAATSQIEYISLNPAGAI